MSEFEIAIVLMAIFVSFVLSSSAGMGGSLVLVPTLMLVFGPKEGVALAALLLGLNNIVKTLAYRHVLPWRAASFLIAATAIGAFVGASILVLASPVFVTVGVVLAIGGSLIAERKALEWRHVSAPFLALGGGATSGFSGTSGPLKGVAIRNLGLDHHHMVGAASLVSLAGDLTKTAVFAESGILGARSIEIAVVSIPLMLFGTFVGQSINSRLGERRYAALFWAVMTGYAVRLLIA